MSLPENYYYTEDHEWVMLEGKEAKIGITEHAQEELGDIVFVELPEVGDEFAQEDDFAVVESVKAVSDVFAPVGGKVVQINEELLDQPELINEDPFEGGWIAKFEIEDEGQLDSLMDSKEYAKFLEEGE